MSAPLVPSPLDYVGRRRFAFYPPIKNIQPNDWVLGAGSWSEVQVVNSRTGCEVWIPRPYIGAVSETHDSVLIVGLTKDLEYRAGTLGPRIKRVIEMPRVLQETPEVSGRQPGPAPVIGIRLEHRDDSRVSKAVATLGIGVLVISLLSALISAMARL